MVKDSKGMTLIVKTVSRITLGFILLYGFYITLNGHMSPGGGFAGGIIVALAFIHIMFAFGKEVALKRMRSFALRIAIGVSSLIFLYIVMAGSRGNFSRLAMPLCEMVITGAGIFTIFIALVLLSRADKELE